MCSRDQYQESILPDTLLETQILTLHTNPTESESPGVTAEESILTASPFDNLCTLNFVKHCTRLSKIYENGKQ